MAVFNIPRAPEFNKALNSAGTALFDLRREHIHGGYPSVLYHYTNAVGLEGILKSGKFWATDYRYLNDASEVTYADSLLVEAIEKRLTAPPSDLIAQFLGLARFAANPLKDYSTVYVTCFSTSDAHLHQWRTYAGSGGGFALGLATEWMGWVEHGCTTNLPTPDTALGRAVYDPTLQRQLIEQTLDAYVQIVGQHCTPLTGEARNEGVLGCAYLLAKNMAPLIACIKHPAFQLEDEWRLFHTPDTGNSALVRAGAYGLTPYVVLDVSPRDKKGVAGPLPIVSVTHGPVMNPDGVKHALKHLLINNNLGSAEIKGSDLPIRLA